MNGLFIGLTSIDMLYPLSGFPEENTKNKCDGHLIDIGGPATNAAFAFSALGGKATLVSLIGDQPFSAFMHHKLREYGIRHFDLNPHLPHYPELSSIWINTQNGSRTIATAKPLRDLPSPPRTFACRILR